MTTRQLSLKAPPVLAIALGATTPAGGGNGAVAWSSLTNSLVVWNGSAWFPAANDAAGSLTAITTVNATATPTTCGVTLATQSASVGATWRIRACGTFVAVSSATARNAQLAAFWGATQLPLISVAVLAATAQTTTWEVEFLLTATSTTAVWLAGNFTNRIGSATALALSLPTPASTAVTAGAQTLDLRASMSVVVATDQWLIHSLVIERLK